MELNNYLNSLKDKIRNLPEGYSKEILKDYENHFKEGLLAGKTEFDIVRELGDVDFIAKNIISEYYIEHSQEVNSEKNTLKALLMVANVIIGTLNLLIITPFILSIVVFVISLYVFDFSLLITPGFLIANLIAPNLPIHFGPEIISGIIWLKVLFVLVCVVIGYYFYKGLKKFSAKFFSWVFRYIIRSIKFQVFNINKYN